jgi:hypothetical protein
MRDTSDFHSGVGGALPGLDRLCERAGIAGSRVDLDRVLAGLRHLDSSSEPVRVFTGPAGVCVPGLCDEFSSRSPSGAGACTGSAVSAPAHHPARTRSRKRCSPRRPGRGPVRVADRWCVGRGRRPPGDRPVRQPARGAGLPHEVLVCRWTGTPGTMRTPAWSGTHRHVAALVTASEPTSAITLPSSPGTLPR